MDSRQFLLVLSMGVSLLLKHCACLDIAIDTEIPSLLVPCTNYDPTNTSSWICQNLGAAIDLTMSRDQNFTSSASHTRISLPEGNHYISSQTNFEARSLSIMGLSENVTVTCDYYADDETEDSDKIHTWFFNRSRSVELRNMNFVGCGFPFRFVAVRRVDISLCTFTYFKEAVLDVYNCQNVTLEFLTLCNNSGNGRLLESARGNTGGIGIGYNKLPADYTNPSLTLSNSNFIGNKAMGFQTPEQALSDLVYLGRGGGVGLFMNESMHDLSIMIADCLFEGNVARLFGGGLFLLTTSYIAVQHQVMIKHCQFINNLAYSGGGGMQLSPLEAGDMERPHTFVCINCLFERNRAGTGGGTYIFVSDQGNYVGLERCNFTGNTGLGEQKDLGAAIAFTYLGKATQRVNPIRHDIVDCVFTGNIGPNGIFSVGYAPLKLSGRNRFIDNDGASLRIIGSLVQVEEEIEFEKNKVSGVGALYLLSFGQIRLSRGAHLKFEENIGRLGSSIVVDFSSTLTAFRDLIFNPRCFLLYEDRMATQEEWEDVKVTFRKNRAIVSSAVYLSQTSGSCSWFKSTPPFFNYTFLPEWPLWSYEDNVDTGYAEPANQALSFGTTANKLTSTLTSVLAWPGQKLELALLGIDDFNHHTSTNVRFIFQPSQNISPESVQVEPQIAVFAESKATGLLKKTYSFTYAISRPDILKSDILGWVISEEIFNQNHVLSDNFTLLSLPCPGGYQLSSLASGYMICTCVDISEDVVFCEDDQNSVVLKHGTWAVLNPSDNAKVNLYAYPCPAGYCRCSFESSLGRNGGSKICVYQFRNSDPDFQCDCGREGVLCGRCSNDAGVSVLLNKCVTCSDGFLALIPLLIAIISAVVAGIVLLDKPLPVLVMPLLFYIQNAPYASAFFPETFQEVGNFLHYISSASGFYFVYDFCLSSHLTTIHSFLLRYIPVGVTSLVYFFIWLSWKMLKKKSMRHYASWWCILLLYSSVTHTSFSILNCPSIPTNGSFLKRWFINGETVCFTGGHIPLALLAIVMMVVCFLFVFFVTLVPILKLRYTKHFMEPLTKYYKDDLKFWCGVELGRRFLFLLALVPFPRNTVFAALVLLISIFLYAYNFPYKSTTANILDIILQLNLLTLLLLEALPQVKQDLFLFPADSIDGTCNGHISNVSNIVYLLAPVYYTPLLVTSIAVSVYLLLRLYGWIKTRDKKTPDQVNALENSYFTPIVAGNFTTDSLVLDY